MPEKEETSARHRMVVEEIEIPNDTHHEESHREPEVEKPEPEIFNESAGDTPEVSEKPTEGERQFYKPLDDDPPVYKQKSPVFWIIIPGLFILGAILGGVFFYQKGVNTIEVKKTPAPLATTAPVSNPTPTPQANVDVSEFDVAIFNGSGIAGEAGKVKTLLTAADFNVVSTANAATYDYKETIIKAKSTVDAAVIEKIKDTLSKNYVIGESQTLAANSTTDIQIVVGSSKAE